MIYLSNTTQAQSVMIPKERSSKGTLVFSAQSTMNLTIFEKEVVNISSSALYFNVSLTLEDGIPAGEYEYILTDEEGVLSSGIMVVGDLSIPVEYTNEVTYEQYETI